MMYFHGKLYPYNYFSEVHDNPIAPKDIDYVDVLADNTNYKGQDSRLFQNGIIGAVVAGIIGLIVASAFTGTSWSVDFDIHMKDGTIYELWTCDKRVIEFIAPLIKVEKEEDPRVAKRKERGIYA